MLAVSDGQRRPISISKKVMVLMLKARLSSEPGFPFPAGVYGGWGAVSTVLSVIKRLGNTDLRCRYGNRYWSSFSFLISLQAKTSNFICVLKQSWQVFITSISRNVG